MASRKPKLLISFGLVAVSWLLLVVTPSTVQAAATPNPGITVSPAALAVTFQAGETQKNLTINISNTYASAVRLVADFQGIDQSNDRLLPSSQTDKSLVANLHLSQTDITVPAHGNQQLILAVSNSAALTPGGHYATLLLSQQTGSDQESNLRAALSLSLFVVRADGAAANLQLQASKLNGSLLALPTVATIDFKNTGNVHAQPHGVITFLTARGTLLAKGIINQASLPLLPGKSLQDRVMIQSLAKTWLPQHLNVIIQYQTGQAGDTAQISFKRWLIPPSFILLLVVVTGLLIITMRIVAKTKLFKRRLRLRSKSPKVVVPPITPLVIRPETLHPVTTVTKPTKNATKRSTTKKKAKSKRKSKAANKK